MAKTVNFQQNIKSGTCAHGMIRSACPICSKGAMGGGHSKILKSSKEWSYQKCYAVGLEIKSALHRKENTKAFWEKNFQKSLNSNKFNSFIPNIKLPIIIKTIQNFTKSFRYQFQTYFLQLNNFFKHKSDIITQSYEKIAAIIGELKNFVQHKTTIFSNKQIKKFISFSFSIIEDENYKNDEILAIFKSRELKKYFIKFFKNNKNR